MALARIHYSAMAEIMVGSGRPKAHCGRSVRANRRTAEIDHVTCKRCLARLWRQIALAHYRAFGAGETSAHGRRMRRAASQSERATRTLL